MQIEIKKVKIGAIKLNPDNPRRIGNAAMDRLVKSLQEFPDMLSIREIVCDETMTVLGGNMRLLALRKIGVKEATAKIVKGLTPEQKREFIVKDNGSWGEWDFDVLANEWGDLPLQDWGIEIPKEWAQDSSSPPAETETAEEPEKPNIIICPKCQHEFSVLREKKE
jgi:ParB-like chromosome segregation protein Spo0J